MIGYYNYTVILTYMGLASGMLGIFSAISGHVVLAYVFLLLAGFFDMFDGMVARTKDRTKNEKKFGIELDSLSDLVCFGVLPAVIGYVIGPNKWYSVTILVLYVLAALIRLAYFNVMEDERQNQTTECRKSYEGLPVTSIAIILPVFYPLTLIFPHLAKYFILGILCVVGFLFLSKITINKFKWKGMIALTLVGLLEMLLLFVTKIL